MGQAEAKPATGAAPATTGPRLRTILFIGPLSPQGVPFRGGPDAANRRLLDFLGESGISITALRFPALIARTLPGFAAYACRYFGLPLATLRAYLRKDHRPELTILSCLYCHFVPLELALALQARVLRRPLVLDLRAGSYEHYYRISGGLYRLLCRRILRSSDLVLTQVPETAAFLRDLGINAEYVPNHVAIGEDLGERPASSDPHAHLSLVYFGALTAEKGVAEMIDICHDLIARGLRASLTLIGSVSGAEKRRWSERIRALGLEGSVVIRPPLAHAALMDSVSRGHFFVFPTRWVGEGHSNSLTEAMAAGMVPVCRDWGCNAVVVGDAGHVLPAEADAKAYAAVIEDTWRRGEWESLSRRSRERVREHYASDVVLPALMRIFQRTAAGGRRAGSA
jgi:glycosyltransferase involved in cell wall biosynthesis